MNLVTLTFIVLKLSIWHHKIRNFKCIQELLLLHFPNLALLPLGYVSLAGPDTVVVGPPFSLAGLSSA